MLKHCKVALFLARKDGEIVGRIAAFIDSLAVDFWGAPIGLFGSYECINDPEVSRLLLDTAANWLRQQGMQAMRGPWSFASQEWGLLVEGFEPPARDHGPAQPDLVSGSARQLWPR